jgi:tetratricopeptide (TPR) repeat protein
MRGVQVPKNYRAVLVSLICLMCLNVLVHGAEAPPKGVPENKKPTVAVTAPPVPSAKRGYVLIARPEGPIKGGWVGALMEQYFYFRFGISPDVQVVTLDSLIRQIPQYINSTQPLFKENYDGIIKKYKVNFILSQNYDLSKDEKTIQHYLEILSVKDNTTIAELEKSYPIVSIAEQLDSIAQWVYQTTKAPLGEHGKRFFAMRVLPEREKTLRELGRAMELSRGTQGVAAGIAGDNIIKTISKDSRALVANYCAALCFARANAADKAVGQMKEILDVVPGYAALYPLICHYSLLAKRYAEVISYAEKAETMKASSLALLIEKAAAQEALGQNSGMLVTYKQILDHRNNEPTALLFFARYYNLQNRPAEALDFIERALAGNSPNAAVQIEKGKSLFGLKRYDEALVLLTKYISTAKTDPVPHEYLGDILLGKGKVDQAVIHYQNALQINPASYSLTIKAVDCLQRIGRYPEAFALLLEAVPKFSDSAAIERKAGLLALRIADTASAQQYLEKYASLEEKDGPALLALANIYAKKGVQQKALYYYNKSLPLLEDQNPCKLSLARFYLKREESAPAIKLLNEILTANPAYPEANLVLGDAYYLVGDAKNALNFYLKARQQKSVDLSVLAKIAWLMYATGARQQAVVEYEKLIAQDSADATPFYRIAMYYYTQKNIAKAEANFQRGARLRPPDPATALELGDAAYSAGKAARAAEFYSIVVKNEPGREDVWNKLAAINLTLGKDSAAAEGYLKLFGIAPAKYLSNCADAGRLFEKHALDERARAAYTAFLEHNGIDPGVIIALARLEYKEKRYDRVVTLLKPLQKPNTSDTAVLRMLADAYYSLERWPEATAVYTQLVNARPADRDILEKAALASQQTGNAALTLDCYLLLLKQPDKGKNCEYAWTIAQLYEQQEKGGQALAQYQKNIELFPTDIRNYVRAIKLMEGTAGADQIFAIAQRAVALPDAPVSLLKKMAQGYAQKSDIVNADIWFKRYCEKQPEDYTAWSAWGTLYFNKKEYAAAIEPFKMALKGMPGDRELLYRLGVCFKTIGLSSKKTEEVQTAIDYLAKAHTLDGKNVVALAPLLAECYRFVKNNQMLITTLMEWRTAEPQNYAVLQELGTLLAQEGRAADAIKALEAASALKPQDVALHLTLADAYRNKGDKTGNLTHLQAAVKFAASNPEIHRQLARHYAADKDYAKAEGEYIRLLALNTRDTSALAEYSQVLQNQNKNKEALQQLDNLLKVDDKNPAAFLRYSRLARTTGQTNLAAKAARRAVALAPQSAEAAAWAGAILIETGSPDSARLYLEKAVTLDQSCVDCYRSLGDLYLADGKFKAAANAYTNALAAGKPNPSIELKLGKVFAFNADYTNARDAFLRVLSADPANSEARSRLVHSLVRLGDIARAKTEAQGMGSGEKKNGWVTMIEAEMKEVDGVYDAAYLSYSVANRLLPDDGSPEAGCGRIKMAKKEFSTAIEFYAKATAKEPYNLEYYFAMGQAYEAINEFGSASSVYAEIVQKQPGFPDIHYTMARVLARQHDFVGAIKVIKQGLSADPQSAKLNYMLGEQYRATDKPKGAITAYDEAARVGGKEMNDANRRIGLLYYHKLIDNVNALKYLKKYVKNGGVDKEVDETIRKIEGK